MAEELTHLGDNLYGEVTYSPDDGGHYVTILSAAGEELEMTDLYPTRGAALKAARRISERLTRTASKARPFMG